MVYCGKPSRACQMCRTRRIKCDETRPGCNQCAKARRTCPGYKDDLELVFRQGAKTTQRRTQTAGRQASTAAHIARPDDSKSSTASPSEGSISPTTSEALTVSSGRSICVNPTMSPAQQAVYFFLANFVLVPQQGTTHGYMEYLIPLLRSEPRDGHFLHAFNACAFAAFANRTHSNSGALTDLALSQYTKALNSTHAALRNPEVSRSDGTLASVLLLGLFENLTAKQLGMFAWGSHIEGAVQLVKARGRKQLRTKVGLTLFITVRTQVIVHSLTSGKGPGMDADWWLSDAVRTASASGCQRLSLKTSELRARVGLVMSSAARTPEKVELMLDCIRQARAIDNEVLAWMESLPDHWQFRTVAWEDKVPNGDYMRAEVFPGRVDAYQDVYIASVWNMARVSRIILALVTVRCAAWVCAPVDYRTTPEYATAVRICVDTITDVIASVPFHFGWTQRRPYLLEKQGLSGFACGDEAATKGLAGFFLTWPLGMLRGLDFTTDAQRAWIVGRLRYIGNDLGVRYAHILAQLQVRIPSMLVRRDGLMAQPYPATQEPDKLRLARLAPPPAGYDLNPLQQREAMQKEYFDQRRAELLAKAAGAEEGSPAEPSAQWVARRWLSV